MSHVDLDRLVDLLIDHVAGLDIVASALSPMRADDVAAPDLAALAVPLRERPADDLRSYRP